MAVQGWPFLIARGRQRGYSVLLAPRFLLAEGDYGFLEEAAGPVHASEPVRVGVAISQRGRRLGLVWSEHRVTAADLRDTDDPRDEHSRPLLLLYGFVCADTTISASNGAGLDHARGVALDTYRRFLTNENGFTTEPSAPFDAHSPTAPAANESRFSTTPSSRFETHSPNSPTAGENRFTRTPSGPFDIHSPTIPTAAPFASPPPRSPAPRPVRRLVIAAAMVVGAVAAAVVVAVAASSGQDPPATCPPPTATTTTAAEPTTTTDATAAAPTIAKPTTTTKPTAAAEPTTTSGCVSTTLTTTPDQQRRKSTKLHG